MHFMGPHIVYHSSYQLNVTNYKSRSNLTLSFLFPVEYPTASSPNHAAVIRGEDGRQVAQWMLAGMSKQVCTNCLEWLEDPFGDFATCNLHRVKQSSTCIFSGFHEDNLETHRSRQSSTPLLNSSSESPERSWHTPHSPILSSHAPHPAQLAGQRTHVYTTGPSIQTHGEPNKLL